MMNFGPVILDLELHLSRKKPSQKRKKYLRETFKDTAFRASQCKMLHKLIYTKKLLHICRLVDTNQCERCLYHR